MVGIFIKIREDIVEGTITFYEGNRRTTADADRILECITPLLIGVDIEGNDFFIDDGCIWFDGKEALDQRSTTASPTRIEKH